ncbi:MAG: response regulator, partial [Campylobacterota bacterium]
MHNILTQDELFQFGLELKVLYVEDDETTREITKKMLSRYFGTLIIAVDGEDGLNKFDHSIDLVMTDINMPKLTGIQMLQKIREKDKSVDTMVISAHNDTSYFTQTIDLGVDGYVLKPVNSKSFKKSLLNVLEKIYLKKDLENHKNMLEQKVDSQIKQLQEKETALLQQSKLAAMGEIMDIIAHQWKNPLNIISMKTSFLEEFHEGEDCVDMQEVKSCKQDVSKQINHLIETIDGFRKFLRPNT